MLCPSASAGIARDTSLLEILGKASIAAGDDTTGEAALREALAIEPTTIMCCSLWVTGCYRPTATKPPPCSAVPTQYAPRRIWNRLCKKSANNNEQYHNILRILGESGAGVHRSRKRPR